MPELPEVETVRDGLDRWVTGRTISSVEVGHPRSVRRHVAGADDLVSRLVGRRVVAASRRGKYLWLPLSGPGGPVLPGRCPDDHPQECLVGHLGMSGQLLVQPEGTPDEKHLHVRVRFSDAGPQLRFVDQRTFGGLLVDRLVPAPDRPEQSLPSSIGHIARDPLDPFFDEAAFTARLRRRDSELKRALLDQGLVSGIGNIYADESLWRARLHGRRRTATLTRPDVARVLGAVREVLAEAIRAGGTSFDALYVNVNGASGYFDRSLAVYGQQDRPCPRCGTPVRRESFMNRSSFSCPVCQPVPRSSSAHAQRTPRRRS